jgi:protein gp37
MNRTKIEWTDFTWNPVTGCKHGCSYCYARKIANHFTKLFPNGFEPTFHPERLDEPYKVPRNFRSKNPHLPKGSAMIFTVSMGDLFGNWVPAKWIEAVIEVAEDNPQHIFLFLTKNPERYREFKFPKNCWLGTTVTSYKDQDRVFKLPRYKEDGRTLNFVSFEPLKGPVYISGWIWAHIDWVIIGAQTNPYKPPKPEWVKSIIIEARLHLKPIFLKDNLCWPENIQEFPEP